MSPEIRRLLSRLFELTHAESIEVHSGDREPGQLLRRADFASPPGPEAPPRTRCADGYHWSETGKYGHQRCVHCGYEWDFYPPGQEAPQCDLRTAWEAGFRLCRNYGDNHAYFDGEQKERQWRDFLATLPPSGLPPVDAQGAITTHDEEKTIDARTGEPAHPSTEPATAAKGRGDA